MARNQVVRMQSRYKVVIERVLRVERPVKMIRDEALFDETSCTDRDIYNHSKQKTS